MFDLAVKAVLAYLIGSVSGSLVLGHMRGIDIRQAGSGNAGGTNALRTQGKMFALCVVVIDIGKGALAAGWLPGLGPFGESVDPVYIMLSCAFACILGHIYPVFFGFRGGKGAATYVGATLVVLPLAVPVMLLSWIFVIVMTGYVGLATMAAALAYVPITLWLAPQQYWAAHIIYAVVGCILIVFTHRENLVRLYRGTENQFEKAMFWKRRD